MDVKEQIYLGDSNLFKNMELFRKNTIRIDHKQEYHFIAI
jgi:hypothetical protein